MAGDFRFSLEESFKNYYRFALQAGGVKGKEHVHGAVGLSRGERGLGRHLFLTNQQGFAGFLVHQNANQLVLLACRQPAVLHSVGDGDLLGRLGGLFAINGCRGANGGLAKVHSLSFIVDVRMGGYHVFSLIQVLEHHHGLARQGGAIEGVGQLHRPLRAGGGELQLGCDLAARSLAAVRRFLCPSEHQLSL